VNPDTTVAPKLVAQQHASEPPKARRHARAHAARHLR
jgi:hypothetical protein